MNRIPYLFFLPIYIFYLALLLIFPSSSLATFPNQQTAPHTIGLLLPLSGLEDDSFNKMTYQGLLSIKDEYDADIIISKIDGVTNDSRYKALKELIIKGAEIIVCNGFEFEDTLKKYAGDYPNIDFLINDIAVGQLPNVYSNIFKQEEASFLAGVLAARMTRTGKIGFIGGKDVPPINAFFTGFTQGIQHVNPTIITRAVYLAGDMDFAPGFNNPALGFIEANKLYDDDFDIIFAAAGHSGSGVIRSAEAKKKFVIGVDDDQDHLAKGYVLTSVMKRLDITTADAVAKLLNGNLAPGVYSFGLKEGGVALSPMIYTKHLIPEETLQELEKLKKKIIKGEIIIRRNS